MEKALLFLRLGIGLMFMFHGYPKLVGGMEKWEMIGQAMGGLGVAFFPVFWGFIAAITEFLGGFLLMIGLLVKPVSLLLAFTMMVATLSHLNRGDGLQGASHAIELGIVFIFLFLSGAGKFSFDARMFKKSK